MITKTRVKIIKLRNAVIAAFFLLLPCSPPFYQPSFHLARSQINEEEEEIVFDRCILHFVFCILYLHWHVVGCKFRNQWCSSYWGAADAVDLLLAAWIFWLQTPPTWLLSAKTNKKIYRNTNTNLNTNTNAVVMLAAYTTDRTIVTICKYKYKYKYKYRWNTGEKNIRKALSIQISLKAMVLQNTTLCLLMSIKTDQSKSQDLASKYVVCSSEAHPVSVAIDPICKLVRNNCAPIR